MRTLFILLLLCQTIYGQVKLQNVKIPNAKLAQNAVSVPPSDTALVTSQALNNGTQNNASLPIGMKIIVGGSPITVTSLGRWVISGNSQTHTLRLRNSSCADLATVTVNCSGAPTGQYLYGSITPTVLSASTTYYVFSDENNSGDLWYSLQAVTTTAVVSDIEGAFDSGGCTLTAGNGFSYVPVNLLYH